MSADQPEALKTLLTQMDARLAQAYEDLKTFHSWFDALQTMDQNIEHLENFYYQGEWAAFAEQAQELFPDVSFDCCGEDSIWDVSQMFFNLKLSLIKRLSDSVYAQIPDGYREDSMFVEDEDGDA